MIPELILPSAELEIESVEIETSMGSLQIKVHSRRQDGECPNCGQTSRRVHSHYERHLHDLPCGAFGLYIELRVRRFFCDESTCHQKTFSERLPEITQPYARRTNRLSEVTRAIGLLLGSSMGVRVLQQVQVSISLWSVLRLLRSMAVPDQPTPRILGVDDWAMRRGRRYGTLLVDLERGKAVDILPDREAQTLANWLRAHPGVEVISRDRAEAYAEGARQGAPDAVQVADRWHVLKNLGDMLVRVLSGYHPELNRLAQGFSTTQTSQNFETVDTASNIFSNATLLTRRSQRFAEVHTLHTQGLSISAIARQTGLDRKTIRKYLDYETLPSQWQVLSAPPKKLAPYSTYLLEHWQYGRRTVRQLYRDIQLQGYTGCLSVVAEFMATVRKLQGLPPFARTDLLLTTAPYPYARLNPKNAAWLLLTLPDKLTEQERTLAAALPNLHPDIAQAAQAAQRFIHLVRHRAVHLLDEWLADMLQSSLPQLRSFARSLQRDYAAVRAALSLHWSNGPVEGHINRLKFIKRQMFGRAKFDLLRLRVLA